MGSRDEAGGTGSESASLSYRVPPRFDSAGDHDHVRAWKLQNLDNGDTDSEVTRGVAVALATGPD
jgi:hypothetical protein